MNTHSKPNTSKNRAPIPDAGQAKPVTGSDDMIGNAKSKWHVTLLLLACMLMLLFFIISTAIPQLKVDGGFASSSVSFWRVKVNAFGQSTSGPVSDIGCNAVKTRLQAGAAFSIIGIFALAGAIALCGMELLALLPLPHIGALCAAGAWFCSLICWSTVAGVYNESHCGGNFGGSGGKYGPGFGLMVFNWIFLTIILVVYALRVLQILPGL